jgi:two-component system OmpR family response regulator
MFHHCVHGPSTHHPALFVREEIDRIVDLELGADDYMSKPFHPREQLASMRAIVRSGPHRFAQARATQFAVTGLTVDPSARSIHFPDGCSTLPTLSLNAKRRSGL